MCVFVLSSHIALITAAALSLAPALASLRFGALVQLKTENLEIIVHSEVLEEDERRGDSPPPPPSTTTTLAVERSGVEWRLKQKNGSIQRRIYIYIYIRSGERKEKRASETVRET